MHAQSAAPAAHPAMQTSLLTQSLPREGTLPCPPNRSLKIPYGCVVGPEKGNVILLLNGPMDRQAWMYRQAWIGDCRGEVKQKADRQSSEPIPAALNSELGSIGSSSASTHSSQSAPHSTRECEVRERAGGSPVLSVGCLNIKVQRARRCVCSMLISRRKSQINSF